MASEKIFIGNIIHCTKPYTLNVIKNGFVVVKENKILEVGDSSTVNSVITKLKLKSPELIKLSKSQLLIPGLIDTHIHAPQYPNCGLGYDKTLMDWLQTYTFPLEKKYKDLDFSKIVYDALVKKTLSYGTTTACYFGSLYKESCIILAEIVKNKGQRALIGKVNMNIFSPEDYVETLEESISNTKMFIKEIISLKSNLIKPVITPRFAVSVSTELLKELGKIAAEGNFHIQSHISENKDEIKIVKDTFKKGYAQVYDEADLLTPKTVMAHAIYLTDDEVKLFIKRGSSISHCPESNLYLKSGCCNVRKLIDAGVKIGLGTDVSGGANPSIISAMRHSISTSINLSFTEENYKPLNYSEVFYLATLGGAEALALQEVVGNFERGKDFDALIVDMGAANSSADYLIECEPEELLQKFIFLGDDRNIVGVFVAGNQVKNN